MIKKYLVYLKDNPQGYWFKAKLYGWGWTPATWQGWLVLVTAIGLIVLNYYRLGINELSTNTVLYTFLAQTTGLLILLIIICYKTGEKPRWQWGLKDRNKPS